MMMTTKRNLASGIDAHSVRHFKKTLLLQKNLATLPFQKLPSEILSGTGQIFPLNSEPVYLPKKRLKSKLNAIRHHLNI